MLISQLNFSELYHWWVFSFSVCFGSQLQCYEGRTSASSDPSSADLVKVTCAEKHHQSMNLSVVQINATSTTANK